MKYPAEIQMKHARHVEELEQKLNSIKNKLGELVAAEDHVSEQLKDGVEGMWTTLQSILEDTVATFKEERD